MIEPQDHLPKKSAFDARGRKIESVREYFSTEHDDRKVTRRELKFFLDQIAVQFVERTWYRRLWRWVRLTLKQRRADKAEQRAIDEAAK